MLVLLLLSLGLALGAASDLPVCRNLHLDEVRFSSASTVSLSIGSGDDPTNSDDSDVSALLDPNDTSRFTTDTYFEIEVTAGVSVTSLSYLENGSGLQLSAPAVLSSEPSPVEGSASSFERVRFAIPAEAYVNEGDAPYTDMRSVEVAFDGPGR